MTHAAAVQSQGMAPCAGHGMASVAHAFKRPRTSKRLQGGSCIRRPLCGPVRRSYGNSAGRPSVWPMRPLRRRRRPSGCRPRQTATRPSGPDSRRRGRLRRPRRPQRLCLWVVQLPRWGPLWWLRSAPWVFLLGRRSAQRTTQIRPALGMTRRPGIDSLTGPPWTWCGCLVRPPQAGNRRPHG